MLLQVSLKAGLPNGFEAVVSKNQEKQSRRHLVKWPDVYSVLVRYCQLHWFLVLFHSSPNNTLELTPVIIGALRGNVVAAQFSSIYMDLPDNSTIFNSVHF